MRAVTVADPTTLPRIVPPVAMAIALAFFVVSCDSTAEVTPIDLGTQVHII